MFRFIVKRGGMKRIVLIVIMLLLCTTLHATQSAAVESPRATTALVTAVQAVTPGQTFRVGLSQLLAPGWHTYWKNPGDAGEPTKVTLTLPEGATSGPILWPVPERIDAEGIVSYGYSRSVLLPIAVTVPASAQPGTAFVVTAEASWLVCKGECVPEKGRFRLEIPVETAARSDGKIAALFEKITLPETPPGEVTFRLEGDALTLGIDGLEAVQSLYFFPASWGMIDHAAPQSFLQEGSRVMLVMQKSETFDAAKLQGVLAVTDPFGRVHWYALDTFGAQNGEEAAEIGLWEAILFALLGGLILNLMPCVFPVLAIKAASIAALAGGPVRQIQMSGVWYTAGVLAAFTVLAGVLFTLRGAGEAVGWGFQLQSPLFVLLMSWLMFLIGLNLSGIFEITGGGLLQHLGGSHSGSFFTGLVAVLVATPCTAPFMGAALGAALGAPAVIFFAIFLAMGLGLALPYALLAFVPGLAARMPRPGAWMVRLRQLLAFGMYATAAWLVWVLAHQGGESGVAVALAGAVLLGFAAWSFGIAQRERTLWPRIVAGIALLATLWLAASLRPDPSQALHQVEPFSEARLETLRREGRPVFVQMTASWCVTCLVNERTVIETDAFDEALRTYGVVHMVGDWTDRDDRITRYLREFRRDGVPFYAVYPSDGGDAVLLPPILTGSIIADAFATAATSQGDPYGH